MRKLHEHRRSKSSKDRGKRQISERFRCRTSVGAKTCRNYRSSCSCSNLHVCYDDIFEQCIRSAKIERIRRSTPHSPTINAPTWNDHISNLYTTCARMTGILRRLDGSIPSSSMKKIYTAVIRPRIKYACAVWSGRTDSKTPTLTRLIFEKTWNNASSPPEEIRLPLSCASLQNT